MTKNDIVLTTIHRLSFSKVQPFFSSLFRTGYSGKLVVFSSSVDLMSKQLMEDSGAQVTPFLFTGRHVRNSLARPWTCWKLLFKILPSEEVRRSIARRVFHLFYLRHLLYLRYLEQNSEIQRVLMCDSRDVYFQENPFSDWPGTGLHAFEEDRSIEIGDCPHHAKWIRTLSGESMFERLRNLPRVCAGTIMADRDSAICFLKQMLKLSYSAQSLEAYDGDQGLYNILIHERLIPNITTHENAISSVLTIGSMPSESLRVDESDFLIRGDKSRIPILHQYDRNPDITIPLLRKLDL